MSGLPETPITAGTRPPEIAGPISRKLTLLRTSIGSRVRPSSSAFCGPASLATDSVACSPAFFCGSDLLLARFPETGGPASPERWVVAGALCCAGQVAVVRQKISRQVASTPQRRSSDVIGFLSDLQCGEER